MMTDTVNNLKALADTLHHAVGAAISANKKVQLILGWQAEGGAYFPTLTLTVSKNIEAE